MYNFHFSPKRPEPMKTCAYLSQSMSQGMKQCMCVTHELIFPRSSRIYLQSRYFRCKNNFPFRWEAKNDGSLGCKRMPCMVGGNSLNFKTNGCCRHCEKQGRRSAYCLDTSHFLLPILVKYVLWCVEIWLTPLSIIQYDWQVSLSSHVEKGKQADRMRLIYMTMFIAAFMPIVHSANGLWMKSRMKNQLTNRREKPTWLQITVVTCSYIRISALLVIHLFSPVCIKRGRGAFSIHTLLLDSYSTCQSVRQKKFQCIAYMRYFGHSDTFSTVKHHFHISQGYSKKTSVCALGN